MTDEITLTDIDANSTMLSDVLMEDKNSYLRGYIIPFVYTIKDGKPSYSIVEFKFGFGIYTDQISIKVTGYAEEIDAKTMNKNCVKDFFEGLLQ